MPGNRRKQSPYLSGVECPKRAKKDYKKDPCYQNFQLSNYLIDPIPYERDTPIAPEAFSRAVGRHPRSNGTGGTRAKADSPLSENFHPAQKYIFNTVESPQIDDRAKSIYKTCGQGQPIPLGIVVNNLKKVRKVGEGVFGEVFVGQFGTARKARIFKIVAIEGRKLVNDQVQRKFEQIESEIIVSQYLNKLYYGYNGCYTEGFVYMHNARICQGKYPQKLIRAWNSYKKHHHCENDKPDYCRTQLYAVFEYDFCGIDICSFHFTTFKQSLAVILQVAHALAVAEIASEFEHRDLHWGNVLIQDTGDLYNVYIIEDKTYKVPCCGLKTNIIDFTISRVTADDGKNIYFDLANDEEQFSGPDELQFGVYKKMRKMTKNVWSKYVPKSNVLWLHYLVCKFIAHVVFTDMASDEHYDFSEEMHRLRNGLLKYHSCVECVQKFLGPFVKLLDETDMNNN